jgi:hypothetical protein
MMTTYYIDESGHSGDLSVNTGDNYDFKGQPYFTLAAIGTENLKNIEDVVAALRSKHKIPEGELKSKSLQSKPKFVAELIDVLIENRHTILVEVVDKRYFVCIEIVNCILLPPILGYDESKQVWWMRNVLVDWLYDRIPEENLNQFIDACRAPSDHSLMSVFGGLLRFAFSQIAKDIDPDISICVRTMVEEAIVEYGQMRAKDSTAHLDFLPLPDESKKNKKIWMLPNLSSFTNLYARLNKLHGGKLKEVRLIHDQQSHFDEILRNAKFMAEGLEGNPFTPHSDYKFIENAQLEFGISDKCLGVQCADIVAGTVMRYFRDTAKEIAIPPEIDEVMRKFLDGQELRTGFGINQVVPRRMVLTP